MDLISFSYAREGHAVGFVNIRETFKMNMWFNLSSKLDYTFVMGLRIDENQVLSKYFLVLQVASADNDCDHKVNSEFDDGKIVAWERCIGIARS